MNSDQFIRQHRGAERQHLQLLLSQESSSDHLGDDFIPSAGFKQLELLKQRSNKQKVGELGTLGTLKNLSKILSQQENNLNCSKSVKQIQSFQVDQQFAQEPSLESHQLHMKHMALQQTLHHRPSSSALNPSFKAKITGASQKIDAQEPPSATKLSNTLTAPLSQTKKAHSKFEKVNKLVKQNLRKQKELDQRKAIEQSVQEERMRLRKKEGLQAINDQVRQLNKRRKPEGTQAKSMGPSVNTSAQEQRKVPKNEELGVGLEQVLNTDFRRSMQQRMSQERGNQRVLSGASKGSRGGGSGKSVGSRGFSAGRSGRSGGVGYQAGHQLGQTSAHAGGKKDSINLNGDQQSQQVVTYTQSQGDIISGIPQYDQIEERLSQEESYRNSTEKQTQYKPFSKNDKMLKRNLIAQAQSSEDLNSYKNRNLIESMNKTSKNITQLLKDETDQNLLNKKSAKNRKNQMGITPSSSVGGPLGLFGLSSTTLQKSLLPENQKQIGLDFLDVKKEIQQELRQVDKKVQQQYRRKQESKHENIMVFKDASIQDLRLHLLDDAPSNVDLRSKSSSPVVMQRQLLRSKQEAMQSQQVLPQTQGLLANAVRHRNKNHPLLTSGGHLSQHQIQNSFINLEAKNFNQLSKQLFENQPVTSTSKGAKQPNKAIQKFIKAKKMERDKQSEQEKLQERSRLLKTQQNLSKLDCFVKKQLQQHAQQNSMGNIRESLQQIVQQQQTLEGGGVFLRQTKSRERKPKLQTSSSKEQKIKSIIDFRGSMNDDQKENIFMNINILTSDMLNGDSEYPTQKRSKTREKTQNAEYLQLDEQFQAFTKDQTQRAQKNQVNSFTSQSLREFGEKVTGEANSFEEITPKNIGKKSSKQNRQNQIMKSIYDIMNRPKSQQKSSTIITHTSPSIQMRKQQIAVPTPVSNMNASKIKMKTIDAKGPQFPSGELISRKKRDKSGSKKTSKIDQKRASLSFRKKNNMQVKNQKNSNLLISTQRQEHKSRSKSNKSRNQQTISYKPSKKSIQNSRSKDRKDKKHSLSNERSKSIISPAKSNSRSRSRSNTRESQSKSTRVAATRVSKLNNSKTKSGKSLSPELEKLNYKRPRNQKEQINSDFDYKKFMHGTIRISPTATKLSQNFNKKGPNLPSGSCNQQIRRQRNRSQTKTTGGNQPIRKMLGDRSVSGQTKSQQNQHSADRLALLDRQSSIFVPQMNLTVDHTKVKQSINKAAKNAKINNEALQQILKKINFDVRRKQKQMKQGNSSKRGNLPAQQMISLTCDVGPQHQENDNKQFKDNNLPHVSPIRQQQDDFTDKQNQLKELLKQIYKKNEQLIKSKVQEKEDNKLQTPVEKQLSNNKKQKYSEEKWVDVPNTKQLTTIKESTNNKQSQLSGEPSIAPSQSLNNFTFLEKTISGKSKQRIDKTGDSMKNRKIEQPKNDVRPSSQQQEDKKGMEKLQKLYLNNINDASSSQSLKFNDMNYPIIVQSNKNSPPRLRGKNTKFILHDFEEKIIDQRRPISSRSGRSIKSGIMNQLNGIANVGGIRIDNEAFYQQLLINQREPPLTALDSQRSQSNQKAFDLLNQDLGPSNTSQNQKEYHTQQNQGVKSGMDAEYYTEAINNQFVVGSGIQSHLQSMDEQAEEEYEEIEVSQKISQINIDKTIESRSIPVSGHISLEPDSNGNKQSGSNETFTKYKNQINSMPQSSLSLRTHKSYSARLSEVSVEIKKDDNQKLVLGRNDIEGPTTLISHLNDPSNEMPDEEVPQLQIKKLKNADDNVYQEASPKHSNGAENLLKYLENKWNEKKQENSSQFDHSRASMASQSNKNKITSPVVEQENHYSASNVIDDEVVLEDIHVQVLQSEPSMGSKKHQQQTTPYKESRISSSKSQPQGTPNEGSQSLIITSPQQRTITARQSEELDNFLDVDIVGTTSSPMIQPLNRDMTIKDYEDTPSDARVDSDFKNLEVRQLENNNEMVIKSNLTTLDFGGDNSSSDGVVAGAHHATTSGCKLSYDDDEFQQAKDRKYIDQFRKRQNRLTNFNNNDKSIELNQIEIEIQENSAPGSAKSSQTETTPVATELPPPSSEEHISLPSTESKHEQLPPIKISEMLHKHQQSPEIICYQILDEIINGLQLKEKVINIKNEEKIVIKEERQVSDNDVLSFIQNSINQQELKHQIKQVVDMKQRQYVENDLIRTDDYINELLQYLLQFELLTQHQLSGGENNREAQAMLRELGGINYLVIFLKNLTQPVKRNLLDILKQYQVQPQGSYDHFESVQDPLKHPILPIDIYLDVEKQREYEFQLQQQMNNSEGFGPKSYNTNQTGTTNNTASMLQESQHILNKSIFDSMNESLTKFRPYGVIGEPLPWSNKYRRLQTDVDINSVDTERLIQMVKQELFRWMSTQQGALLHSHDSIFQYIDLQVPLMPELQLVKEEGNKEVNQEHHKTLEQIQEKQFIKFKKQIIEEATQEMRQSKLASQLQHEILEDEHYWLNYEFEETQIRVELGDLIFDKLMMETIEFLQMKEKECIPKVEEIQEQQ